LSLACLREAAVRFVSAASDDTALKVDTGCAASLPRPAVFVPIAPVSAPAAPAAVPASAASATQGAR
jgi:hypothetical protein